MFVLIKIWEKREKISVKGELYFYDAKYRISWTYRIEWTLLLCMSSYIYICQSTSLSPSSLLNYIPQGTSWLSFLLFSQRNAPCTLTCSSISRTLRVLSPFLHCVLQVLSFYMVLCSLYLTFFFRIPLPAFFLEVCFSLLSIMQIINTLKKEPWPPISFT